MGAGLIKVSPALCFADGAPASHTPFAIFAVQLRIPLKSPVYSGMKSLTIPFRSRPGCARSRHRAESRVAAGEVPKPTPRPTSGARGTAGSRFQEVGLLRLFLVSHPLTSSLRARAFTNPAIHTDGLHQAKECRLVPRGPLGQNRGTHAILILSRQFEVKDSVQREANS